VSTAGLTPLSDDIEEYVGRIRTWTRIAREVMAPERR
jgi:hypothetical protein